MKIKTQGLFYQFLLLSCIVVSLFSNYELTFAVWSVTLALTLQKRYSLRILKYVSFFVAIIALAFVVSMFRDNKTYNIIRDITYFLKPIIGLLVGYQLCKFNSKTAFNIFIYVGVLIASMHLILILIAFFEYKTLSVNLIRQHGGFFSDYEIYVLVILIFHENFQLSIPRNKIRILILIVGLSSFLYLARTNLIQFIVFLVAMKGYFKATKKSLQVLTTIAICVLVAYSAIFYLNPKRHGSGLEAFFYKIKIAPIEPFKTKINKENWKDFNDNYRSYENIITVKQVSKNGTMAVLFGEGLGSTLDLGREVLSNDGEFVRYIPIVHNGYMTVFMKSGLLGVFILCLSIIVLFRQKKSNINQVQQINLLLIGTSVFLVFSNWVFLGVYLKLDNKSIIIGFLIALQEVLRRENQRKSLVENE